MQSAREGEQVGFVPRDLAAELAVDLDAGPGRAVVLRERWRSPRDPRSGSPKMGC